MWNNHSPPGTIGQTPPLSYNIHKTPQPLGGASQTRGLETIARKRIEDAQSGDEALNEAQVKETPPHFESGSMTGGTSSSETGPCPSASVGAPTLKDDEDRADGDSMWKTLMQLNFDEMLESILPELAARVDHRRKTEFLDKEMKDLQAFMGAGWQAPDLLAKVPVKGGRDIWLALHVEVQGKGGDDFPERMFYYHSMIRFKYLKRKEYEEEPESESGEGRVTTKNRKGVVDVVSLAILTARRPKGEPEIFERALFGNELRYVYPTVRLWELDANRLEKSRNPFDLALLAARRMIDSGRSDNKRIAFLKQLGGLLDERGWTRERCLALYRFIEWALRPLSEEKLEEYRNWAHKEEKKMYVTVFEKIGIEKGMEIGLEKGKEIGEEIGKEIGKEIGEEIGIEKGKEIGKEIGKGEGILIGKEETKREAAVRMLDKGAEPSFIAECLDLPEEEVLRIRDERS